MLGLGLTLPMTRPNAYAGVRLPWTMRSPTNWKLTHRLTGALYLIAGIGMGVLTYLAPDPRELLAALMAALLLPVAIGGLASFLMSLRKPRA